MRNLVTRSAWVAVIGGTLLLAGCASVDDVKRAQATADQALDAAHSAQQTADQARSDVNALSGRVSNVEQEVNDLKARHRGQRG
jgi:outer membrane murein-binding lipoprotein Lpp